MKKIFSAILMLSTIPAFATGVPSTETTADCDNTTLNTYTGTSNLQADWRANTIALHWYSDGEELNNIPTESQSCTYDGILTPPSTIPTKTGYTFKGWQIPTYDFATIPTNVNGTNMWTIGWHNNANLCEYNGNGVSCSSDNTYTELQTYEWKVKYSHGDLYGTSKCSTTSGTWGQPGTPSDTDGQYCWCKATGYKVGGTDVIRKPLSALSWVCNGDRGSVGSCAELCAGLCVAFASGYYSDFRGALFGVQ